jgi:hypothetical protein
MSILVSKWNYTVVYEPFIGGVAAYTAEHFRYRRRIFQIRPSDQMTPSEA